MRNHLVIAAALSSVLAFGANAASAAQVAATGGGCAHIAQQVQAAIDANPTAAGVDQARKDQNAGRSFCSNQLYSNGVASYQHALDVLGSKG
jgi:hypothetical protein